MALVAVPFVVFGVWLGAVAVATQDAPAKSDFWQTTVTAYGSPN